MRSTLLPNFVNTENMRYYNDGGLFAINQTSTLTANSRFSGAGTISNAPVAGNPDHWLQIFLNSENSAGTFWIPCWSENV